MNACHAVRPAVCPGGTTAVRPYVRHGVGCWVQNQNQNQTVVKYRFSSFWLSSNSKLRSVWGLGIGGNR